MKNLASRRSARLVFALVAGLSMLFVATVPAEAQIFVGGKSRGKKVKEKRQKNRGPKSKAWSNIGSHRCEITKFELAEGDEEEKFIGTIKVHPLEKDAKPIKVLVPRSDELVIELEGYKFTAEEFFDLPLKGLYCTVSWGYPEDDLDDGVGDRSSGSRGKGKKKSSRKKKRTPELKSISFDRIEVKGTISEIEDDLIILKVRPKDKNRLWPNIEARMVRKPDQSGEQKKRRKTSSKKIKLRIFDDVAKFYDGNKEPLDLADFEVGQEIEASVIFGSKIGFMVAMHAPGVGDGLEDEFEDDEPRRGGDRRRTPGRRGRPRP